MNSVVLGTEFERMVDARSVDDIAVEADRFRTRQGFDRYGLMVKRDDFSSAKSDVTLLSVDNSASGFSESDPEVAGKLDPVMLHLKRSGRPIVYDQNTYTASGMGHVWEYQAPQGFAFGIATVLHLPGHLHVTFGIDSARRPPTSKAELTQLVAETQLFSTLIHEAALDAVRLAGVGTAVAPAIGSVRLSPRERECLNWAASGKTAWETSIILSIAEGSVAKVLASAIRKLNCSTKSQAVVKALRLGLIG